MHRTIWIAAFALACVDEAPVTRVADPVAPDETLGEVVHPAVLPPPLPVVMGLESTPWHAGDTALLTATDAIPGAKVYFLAGSGIGSTCLAKLGGDCVDLKRPALLGSAIADNSGEAWLAVTVDAAMVVGDDAHLQAVVIAGAPYMSEPLSLVVEPVCGDGVTEGDETCDDGALDDGDGCSGDCQLEASDDFLLFLDAAEIARKDPATNSRWDFDPFGLVEDPEAYVAVYVDGAYVGRTSSPNNTLSPVWGDTFAITVPDDSFLLLEVWDADSGALGGDDFIGAISFLGADLDLYADIGPLMSRGDAVDQLFFELTSR
jgi:cysteine-rich repeat protein